MRFLATEWMKSSYAEMISYHEVYLALDNTCHFFTAVDGDVRDCNQDGLPSRFYSTCSDGHKHYHTEY